MRALEPETAHRAAITALRQGLVRPLAPAPAILAVTGFGKKLNSPLGIAAGLDKGGEAIAPLLRMGVAFMEIGAVTPQPQPGNPRPRLFRLPADRALINRYGFNSEGLAIVAERLRVFRRYSRMAGGVVGVNLGVNKDSPDPQADYVAGVKAFARDADFVTVNVSSPNTAGLRDLQQEESLLSIIRAARDARDSVNRGCRLMVKLAPDLTDDAAEQLVSRVTVEDAVDGWIVSNTTIIRPPTLQSQTAKETGGLSGPPLYQRSTDLIRVVWRASGGATIIGAGGIDSGAAAYGKICAGASLLQLYTAMVYEGPAVLERIQTELAECLSAGGHASVADAVGIDASD